MEINTIVMLSSLVFLIVLVSLSFYFGNKETEKEIKMERIDRIHKNVKYDLESITRYATRSGDKFYNALMDFANKMEKLSESEVKDDLKPYDVYNVKPLNENLKHISRLLGRIVIDKNLEPRFMTSYISSNAEEADIELEVALSIDEVKELANKCRKIKMNTDIEAFRQEKVKKVINNK
jgi:hypothetical protein